MNKEQVYDEKINPLMAQIIKICDEYGIAMLCDFVIPTPEDDNLKCTTIMPDEKGKNPVSHKIALAVLAPGIKSASAHPSR